MADYFTVLSSALYDSERMSWYAFGSFHTDDGTPGVPAAIEDFQNVRVPVPENQISVEGIKLAFMNFTPLASAAKSAQLAAIVSTPLAPKYFNLDGSPLSVG